MYEEHSSDWWGGVGGWECVQGGGEGRLLAKSEIGSGLLKY